MRFQETYWVLNKNYKYINYCTFELLQNPCFFEIDFKVIEERCNLIKEELIKKCFHPNRVFYYIEKYNYNICNEEVFDL